MGRILREGRIPSGSSSAPHDEKAVQCGFCHSIIAYGSNDLKSQRIGYNNVTLVYYLDCPVCKREIHFNSNTEAYRLAPFELAGRRTGKAKCYKCRAKFKYEYTDILLKEESHSSTEYVLCPQCQELIQLKMTAIPYEEDYGDDD